MSYPDVVSSSRNQSPQRPVNVTQRTQLSSAALIENEAGIKKGHVNNIASLFGSQQNPTVSRRPSANSGRQQVTAESTTTSHFKKSRIAVVPKETSISASQAQSVSSSRPVQSARGDTTPKSPSITQPAPWPTSTVGQLKSLKSQEKPDSEPAPNGTSGQPTIVINKAKYVPRTARGDEKINPNRRQSSGEVPTGVKVGRWTVYETLPFGKKENNAREGEQRKQDEDWKRFETLERDKMAEAERRKAEYDRKHREELEAQEKRRQKKLLAEEQRRKRQLEIEEEQRQQRADEERRRRREIEEQEKRRLEEEEREVAGQENERRLREAREKRRLELLQEEEQRQRMERRRQAEREELERRRNAEESERRRAEESRREEETRRKEEELQRREEELRRREEIAQRRETEKALGSNSDLKTTVEEWTVYESVPPSQASFHSIEASQTQPSYSSSYSKPTRSLRKSSGKENSGESDASIESEYMRNLREIEEKQRQQKRQENNSDRYNYEEEKRHQDEKRNRDTNIQEFQEGVEQWRALADKEPYDSGSVIGYRRFLDSGDNSLDQTSRQKPTEDQDRHRDHEESQARMQRQADEERRRREENNREEMEAEQRRQEVENRRRREEERRRREADERRQHQLEEDQRRQNRFDRWRSSEDSFDSGRGASGFFKQDEWAVFDPLPGNQDDSVLGYRRFLDEDEAGNDRSRSTGWTKRSTIRISNNAKNDDRREETHTELSKPVFSDEEAPRFEEWTEYHSVAPQVQAPSFTRHSQLHRQSSEHSDESEDTPKFDEWTEVHKVPASQVEIASGYDAVDAGTSKSQPRTFADEKYDNSDADEYSTSYSRRKPSYQKPRFQSSESLNQTGKTDEPIPVEEIMPRRRSSGRRQRDALIAAAIRHLESSDPKATTSFSNVDAAASATADTPTARVSPYHSYQRIYNDRRGRYRGDDGSAVGRAANASNGNIFQDSFNVNRDNPAYYWHD